MPSETIERLAGRFREHRRRFEEFCRSLSEEELSRAVPDSAWTVKDFASHLGTLDAELIRWFDAVKAVPKSRRATPTVRPSISTGGTASASRSATTGRWSRSWKRPRATGSASCGPCWR